MKSSASILVAAAAMLAGAMANAQTAPPAPGMPGSQPAAPATPVRPLPASQWTMPQVRQSFELADSDSNGQLTRAEAQQLRILPRSFEEMDQNKDNVIGREEYESIFTR